MADIRTEVVTVKLSQGAVGTFQDIIIPGFGTPKAAVFLFSGDDYSDRRSFHAYQGYGFTDGTRQCSFSAFSRTWFGAGNKASRISSDSKVIVYPSGTLFGVVGGFSFNSWITDGLRIEVESQLNSPRNCTVMLFNGADIANVYCDTVYTSTNPVDVTAPGFQPDLVLGASAAATSALFETEQADYSLSFGWSFNSGGTERALSAWRDDRNNNASCLGLYVNASFLGILTGVNTSVDLTDWDANGFSVNCSGVFHIGYLAFDFTTALRVRNIDSYVPDTGNLTETGASWDPQAGIFLTLPDGVKGSTVSSNIFGHTVTFFDTHSVASHTVVAKDFSPQSGFDDDLNFFGKFDDTLTCYDDDGDKVLESNNMYSVTGGFTFELTTNPAAFQIPLYGLMLGEMPANNKFAGVLDTPEFNMRARDFRYGPPSGFMDYKVFRVNEPQVGKTYDIEIPGFGQPGCALFFWNGADQLDSHILLIDEIYRQGIGFTDGTAQRSTESYAYHNPATTQNRAVRADRCISLANVTSELVGCSFDSWLPNGVRIKVDAVTGNNDSFVATVLFFKGSIISNAHIGNISDLGTSDNTINVTSPGFTPDIVFFVSAANTGNAPAYYNDYMSTSWGCALNDGIESQKVVSTFDMYSAFDYRAALFRGRSIAATVRDAGVTVAYSADLTAFTASGFDLDVTGNAGNTQAYFLALKFSAPVELSLGHDNVSQFLGPMIVNQSSFTPKAAIAFGTSGFNQTYDIFLEPSGVAKTNALFFDERKIVNFSQAMQGSFTPNATYAAGYTAFDLLQYGSGVSNEFTGASIDGQVQDPTFTTEGWTAVVDDFPTQDWLMWSLMAGDDPFVPGPPAFADLTSSTFNITAQPLTQAMLNSSGFWDEAADPTIEAEWDPPTKSINRC